MNSDDRARQLRLAILNELNACGTHACPETALVNAMYGQVNPPPTKTEVLSAAKWLEDEDYLVVVPGSLGGANKYRITDNGRAAIHA